jgi:hypothetical protein
MVKSKKQVSKSTKPSLFDFYLEMNKKWAGSMVEGGGNLQNPNAIPINNPSTPEALLGSQKCIFKKKIKVIDILYTKSVL